MPSIQTAATTIICIFRCDPRPHRLQSRLNFHAILIVLLLVGCSRQENDASGDSVPLFVTTIHPFRAILMPIVGEQGRVIELLSAGASPHTYAPTPSDVRQVAGSEALVYGAEQLDGWAADLSAPARIALLPLVPDSLLHPFPSNHETAHGHTGVDPHFWTDPLTVKAMIPALVDRLCELVPAHCSTYESNGRQFAQRLDSLHTRINARLQPVQGTPVLLTEPFFQYFLERYQLRLVGVIQPIPGQEPSPKTLQQVIIRARRQDVEAIFSLPQLPSRAAQIVSEATGIPVYELDPIGGGAGRDSYEELLMYNVRTILEALQ